ncbi:gp16 family phage-associated protein [Acidovorax sp. 94]|jgi:gp16 family phage-associated protein|uniref:DNA-binding protein n=1 Tax=Acidovorax sp. 94 TaxID=2135633 RepID=UPI000EB08474|nr:DNA-binding protein [Acidovorax sp. 94]RKR66318.1 gp16 family phage-associated protein [Acidovorax sp. 94]
MLKTRAQVRDEFARKGWSISGWAKQNGYSPNMVIAILADNEANLRLKCLRGDAHNIAVQLGLKEGEISRAVGARQLAAA